MGWQNMAKQRNQVSNRELHPKFAKKRRNVEFWWFLGNLCPKTDFSRIFQIPAVWALFPAVFPLFSRCFPAVRAQFPLFSRCFPLFSRHFDFRKVLQSKCAKKQNFRKFGLKQWFCSQIAQKNRIFRNLAQNSGFAAKTHKTREFSQVLPRTGQNKQNNINFKNLAQNRSKQHKKNKFSKKIAQNRSKRTKTHILLRFCARTGVLQSKRTKKPKISEILPKTVVCGQSAQNKQPFQN